MPKLSSIVIFIHCCFVISGWTQNPTVLKCSIGENETEEKVGEFSLCVKTEKIPLVQSTNLITIKTYTRTLSGQKIDRTFVVVHNNERKGLAATKEVIAEYGGRLVEVVSNHEQADVNDDQFRYLFFGEGKKYCIDPNRIFSKNGLDLWLKESDPLDFCKKVDRTKDSATIAKILNFGKVLRSKIEGPGISFIIGIHNNKGTSVRLWASGGSEAHRATKISHSVPVSPYPAPPENNFVLVSNRMLYDQLVEDPVCCYVALQLNRNGLLKATVANEIDDGSMSIFYGATPFSQQTRTFAYINIEAYGKSDPLIEDEQKRWQKAVIKKALTLRYK